MSSMFIASDHWGIELKSYLMAEFPSLHWVDLGPNETTSVDYPDYAQKLAEQMKNKPGSQGILICGSGQGMTIKANRYNWIRAALCYSPEITQLAREHNNANVMCIGARFTNNEFAKSMLQIFLKTQFAGGRHETRVQKLS
jgi:ribose 5-phosphate isomerase B